MVVNVVLGKTPVNVSTGSDKVTSVDASLVFITCLTSSESP